MRIIAKGTLRNFWEKHRDSKASLMSWHRTVKAARWTMFADVRNTINSVDQISKDDKHYVIFNIGDDYRLVAGVNYVTQVVYIRKIMTHGEYDRNQWKAQL